MLTLLSFPNELLVHIINTMLTLLSFPNELLVHIINDVDIDDIEAFSSCCEPIKLLAAGRLEKHLARKLMFPAVAIQPTNDPEYDYEEEIQEGTVPGLIPTVLLQDFLMDGREHTVPLIYVNRRHSQILHWRFGHT